MALPTRCYYFRGLAPGALASEMEAFSRDIADRVILNIDGANLSDTLLDDDCGLEWERPGPGTPKRICSPILSNKSVPSLRRKGSSKTNPTGLEFHINPADTTNGKVCTVDGRDPDSVQRLSFAIDEWTASNPGASITAPTGSLTTNTGGAFDNIMKRNGVEGLRQDGTGLLASKFWRFATGLGAGPQITGPGDQSLIIDSPGGTDIRLRSTDTATMELTQGNACVLQLTNDYIRFKLSTDFYAQFLHANSADRTYTLQNRDGTIADDTDLAGKQNLDATLTALAGLATGANKMPYSTGTDTFSQYDIGAEAASTKVPVSGTNSKLDKAWIPRPKGFIEGARLRYSSTTAIIIEAGSARNGADDGDLSISETTVPITSEAAFASTHGLDRKALTGTGAVTAAGTSITGTTTAFLTEFGTRALSVGTIGTGGAATTTITGTSTKFFTDVAVHDLIGNSSVGFARVTAIASDTSLTVSSNLTISNGSTGNIIENPTVFVVDTSECRRVNTITSNTALTVTDAWDTTDASSALKAGGEIDASAANGNDTKLMWLYAWVVSNGTNTIGMLSTQRTTPLLSTVTSKRLVGVVLNGSTGDLTSFQTRSDGNYLWCYWTAPDFWGMLSGGTSTSYARTIWPTDEVPPVATAITLCAYGILASSETEDLIVDFNLSINGTSRYDLASALVDNSEHRGLLAKTYSVVPRCVDNDKATYYLVDRTSFSVFLAVNAWGFER